MTNVKLQPFVLVGFSDIAGAGCRALLGVDLHYHTDAEKCNPQIENKDGTGFLDLGFVSCKGDTEFDNAFSPVQILNIPLKNVSMLIINCQPSPDMSSHLVNWVMDLLITNNVQRLHILAALNMANAEKNVVYEMSMFQEKSQVYPEPPNEMTSSDNIFNKLIQFIHVVKIPTSCLVVSGQKAREGIANKEELQTIQLLQTLAEERTGVKFNILTSRELTYAEVTDTINKDVTSMYL